LEDSVKLFKTILGDLGVVLIALTIGASAGTIASCTTTPPKQVAVEGAQSVESALDTAQDFERSVCFNNPSTRQAPTVGESGRHCTNPVAATVGLTDAIHVQIETALGQAFTTQVKVADALTAWQVGQAPPGSLADLSQQIQGAVGVVQALLPNGKGAQIIKDILAIVDAVNQIAGAVGAPLIVVPTGAGS
jgi:hypothetical protein